MYILRRHNMNNKPSPITIILSAIQLFLLIAGLVSIINKPLPFRNKWMWIPLLSINIIGPIIYFVIGSPSLDDKAAMLQE